MGCCKGWKWGRRCGVFRSGAVVRAWVVVGMAGCLGGEGEWEWEAGLVRGALGSLLRELGEGWGLLGWGDGLL